MDKETALNTITGLLNLNCVEQNTECWRFAEQLIQTYEKFWDESVPAETQVSQPSEPTCENCKHEEFSDKAGSLCKKHNQWLNEMFPNTDLTLSELGCRQFEQRERRTG